MRECNTNNCTLQGTGKCMLHCTYTGCVTTPTDTKTGRCDNHKTLGTCTVPGCTNTQSFDVTITTSIINVCVEHGGHGITKDETFRCTNDITHIYNIYKQ